MHGERERIEVALARPHGSANGESILAFGSDLDPSVCLLRGDRATIVLLDDDLSGAASADPLRAAAAGLEDEFGTAGSYAHDAERNLRAAVCAIERPGRHVAVQHQHAHFAAALAEHGVEEAVGVILDGPGVGPDGTIWGGELFAGSAGACARAGLLFPVRLPGGGMAALEPWRMACAWLAAGSDGADPDRPPALAQNVSRTNWEATCEQARLGVGSPLTTCAMRLLDAVAVVCGLSHDVRRDGDAARELVAFAEERSGEGYELPLIAEGDAPILLDARVAIAALLADLAMGTAAATAAGRFREGLAFAAAAAAARAAADRGFGSVVLAGRCFEDPILLERTASHVEVAGLRPLSPRALPTGDGAVSLGQAAVAAATAPGGSRASA
jgi:hydrogenase maturation protein HypF